MEIARIDVFDCRLTYVHGAYAMSRGRVVDALPSTLVRITAGDGAAGWGEVCPLGPAYLPAFAEGARAALRELAPRILGLDARNLGVVDAAMDRALAGHGYAKSALEEACWDLLGQATGQPVSMLLGGTRRDRYPLYVAIPLGPPAEMARHVEEAKAEGIARFQLKLGDDPETDAARARAVVEATGDGDVVVADANAGWRLQDAIVAARLLDGLPRTYLEQPCVTLEECLYVRERTSLPMILDEVIVDVPSLLRAHRAGGMEAINLKISKVGGLSRARTIRDLATALGLRLTIEDTWGGDVATAAISHLAASTDPDALFTVSHMNAWVNEHVAGFVPRSRGGVGEVPAGPGLGIEVDAAALGEPLFTAG